MHKLRKFLLSLAAFLEAKYFGEPMTDQAMIDERFLLIKSNIAKCKTPDKLRGCEDAITLLLDIPFGEKAFIEIYRLKTMVANKYSSIDRRANELRFADEVIAKALKTA